MYNLSTHFNYPVENISLKMSQISMNSIVPFALFREVRLFLIKKSLPDWEKYYFVTITPKTYADSRFFSTIFFFIFL